MRSRFSAFAVEDAAYLLRSWHPETRPPRVDFDAGQRWHELEILATGEGSAFHTTGTVTFRARYTFRGSPASCASTAGSSGTTVPGCMWTVTRTTGRTAEPVRCPGPGREAGGRGPWGQQVKSTCLNVT